MNLNLKKYLWFRPSVAGRAFRCTWLASGRWGRWRGGGAGAFPVAFPGAASPSLLLFLLLLLLLCLLLGQVHCLHGHLLGLQTRNIQHCRGDTWRKQGRYGGNEGLHIKHCVMCRQCCAELVLTMRTACWLITACCAACMGSATAMGIWGIIIAASETSMLQYFHTSHTMYTSKCIIWSVPSFQKGSM